MSVRQFGRGAIRMSNVVLGKVAADYEPRHEGAGASHGFLYIYYYETKRGKT